ncbi:hypothetical protein QBC36DRAFT_299805 [Triangularia setosa]|uniref:Uncharacterized protein n=1 Tax=Triangularia setosa TaxID=2587417 RepID=A0AAN6WC68_9PEZI|nr:hypothetical protein QBC36DRAFT_299805 [Podospora setosa]
MARIKTADGKIIQTANTQTPPSNSSNPTTSLQSLNEKTKRAHQRTLEALTKDRHDFISRTAAIHLAEKTSDRQAAKAYKKESSCLKQQWERKALSDGEYRKALKDLELTKEPTDKVERQRGRFWKEVIENRLDVDEEIERREKILNNWKNDGVVGKAKIATLGGDQDGDPVVCPRFCTPECLLGLKQGKRLDLDCPNVVRHRRGIGGIHQISRAKLDDLIKQQLSREQDGYQNLRCVGDSLPGQPEKSRLGGFTLQPYGYTFLVKGYTYWWKRRARHERDMYNRIDSFHNDNNQLERAVPLCFGLFNLPVPYPLPTVADTKHGEHGDNLGHILLLSYGTVPSSTTIYPPFGFNETSANKRLQTMIMGQYGIGFSESNTGFSALWGNGRLVSIGLDEGSVIQWRYAKARVRRKSHSRRRALESFLGRSVGFQLREEERKKRKTGHLRWVSMVGCDTIHTVDGAVDGDAVGDGTPGPARLPDSLGAKLP